MAAKAFHICLNGKYRMGLEDRSVKLVGVMGVLLLLSGTLQMGGGVYFILTMPVVSVASNIWTGAVSGLAGTVLTYFGCTNQIFNRAFILITFCVVTIVANVANVVITQVGEQSLYEQSKNASDLEDAHNKPLALQIGLWLTTGATVLALLSSFVLANYLFCGQVKGRCSSKETSLIKTISEEFLHHKTKNRFFPPSRLIHQSKEEPFQPLPSMDDIVALPDPSSTQAISSWVYRSDDKVSFGLYPLGIEIHQDGSEGTRHPPMRRSSFAAPRYAKVHQRPQRAQSFVARRDPFSIHVDRGFIKPSRVEIPKLPISKNPRWRSLTVWPVTTDVITTLSSKYRAFSLERDADSTVIEVGSLKSSNSDHSLANALTDLPTDIPKVTKQSMERKEGKIQRSITCGPSFLSAGLRNKGPAPQPPIRRYEFSGNKTNVENGILETLTITATPSGNFFNKSTTDSLNHWRWKENSETSSSSSAAEIKDETTDGCSSISFNSHCDRKDDLLKTVPNNVHYSEDERNNEAVANSSHGKTFQQSFAQSILSSSVYEIPRPARVLMKNNNETLSAVDIKPSPKISQKLDKIDTPINLTKINSAATPKDESKPCQITHLDEHFRMTESSFLSKPMAKGILKRNTFSSRTNYENVHRQVDEDPKILMENLSSSEVQRNKIILRVPSFKTTGCQTEACRPVRRRMSCYQGHRLSVSRSYHSDEQLNMREWQQQSKESTELSPNVSSNSSSGYSSPDGDSKDSSPVHSGPPSPGSLFEVATKNSTENGGSITGPNITIIEVNNSEPQRYCLPQRPQKPLRLRPLSDASTLYAKGYNFSPGLQNRQPSITVPLYKDINIMTNAPQDGALLIDSVSQSIFRNKQTSDTIPRIIDVIPKKDQRLAKTKTQNVETNPTSSEDRATNEAQNTNVKKLLVSIKDNGQHSLLDMQNRDTLIAASSTAAYLASLELLASHYRQQALANAKQLQMQRRLLEQQRLQHQKNQKTPIYTISRNCENENFILEEEASESDNDISSGC